MLRRPHDPQNQICRDDQKPTVDIFHFDVVGGDDGNGADDHVPTGKGKSDRSSCIGVLLQERLEVLRARRCRLSLAIQGEDRPPSCFHSEVGVLSGTGHCDVVTTRRHDCATEGVSAELDGNAVPPVGHLRSTVGQRQLPTSVGLGQSLVLCSLGKPFVGCFTTQLGSEILIRFSVSIHWISRSRHSGLVTR